MIVRRIILSWKLSYGKLRFFSNFSAEAGPDSRIEIMKCRNNVQRNLSVCAAKGRYTRWT